MHLDNEEIIILYLLASLCSLIIGVIIGLTL